MKRRKFIQNSALMAGGYPFFERIPKPSLNFDKSVTLEIYQTNWGYEGTLDEFCKQTKAAGYHGIEVWAPTEPEKRKELEAAVDKHELKLGLLVGNRGMTFEEQLASFKKSIGAGVAMKPSYINCHSGKDYFSFEQNSQFLYHSFDLADKHGIRTSHETHRARMLFAAHVTERYADAHDQLELTLDISHWCVVHGSLLGDQSAVIDKLLDRTSHIHARVGFENAPQVPNFDDPKYEKAVKAHFKWWDAVVKRKSENSEKVTITTEFGPATYMWTYPYENRTLANNWDVNLAMRKALVERYLSVD